MKFIDKQKQKMISFEEIPPCEYFYDEDNEVLYMKISDVEAGMGKAVNLNNGIIYLFDLDEEVLPVQAEITLY